ncbi:MAG: hypothetical protein AAF640_02080 [Pseudomonadota bacterium]
MTELSYLIRKRADLSNEQFKSACARYEAFLMASAEALGIKEARVQQSLETICEKCFSGQRKLDENRFHGRITLRWDSLDDYVAGAGSAAGIAAMDALVAKEKGFIDLGKSQALFLEDSRESLLGNESQLRSQILSS